MCLSLFECIFEKRLHLGELCNDSRLYKNVYKVLTFENISRKCLWNVFLKVIFEKCLCNGSRLYKNAYKELCLLKMFQMKVWVYKMFFL